MFFHQVFDEQLDQNPKESFSFDRGEERYSMYALKAHVLLRFYWHGMSRGRA